MQILLINEKYMYVKEQQILGTTMLILKYKMFFYHYKYNIINVIQINEGGENTCH